MTSTSFRSSEPWMFVPDQTAWPSATPFAKPEPTLNAWTSQTPSSQSTSNKWSQANWSQSWDATTPISKPFDAPSKKTSPVEQDKENLVLKFDELSLIKSTDFDIASGTPIKKPSKKKTPPAPIQAPTVVPSVATVPSPVDQKPSSSGEEEVTRQSLYKTELCRSFAETGSCRYGHKCQFAHGQHELRVIARHPKYKTENCKTFVTTGHCPYGNRCCFIHPTETVVSPPTSPATNPSSVPSVEWSTSWNTPTSQQPKKSPKKTQISAPPTPSNPPVPVESTPVEATSKRLSIFKKLTN